MVGDPLADARLLYQRAQDHVATYNKTSSSDDGLWRIAAGRDGNLFAAVLILDRDALNALKPLISDIANNLIHALDLVSAAAYLSSSNGRPRNLYFPIAAADAAYEKKSKALEGLLDPIWLDLFAATRERHKLYQGYLELLKSVSNDVKHWHLIAGGAGPAAIAWHVPGAAQTIVEIPKDYFVANDIFEFWRQAEPFPKLPITIITHHRFENAGADAASVDSVFSTCSRFVADIIAESSKLLT